MAGLVTGDARLTELHDRHQIRDLVATYCRSVDRMDLAAVRGIYTRDGIDHHTGFDGTADDYVAWLGQLLPQLNGTQHLIGNHLAEIYEDEAAAETYGTAVHWGTPCDDPARNFTSGFRYVDHLVREVGVWRIRERWAVREWTHSDVGSWMPVEAPGPRGTRGPDDALCLLRARITHQHRPRAEASRHPGEFTSS